MVSGTHRTWSVGPVGHGQWDQLDVVSGTSWTWLVGPIGRGQWDQ